jgi:hypothetical protein
VALLDDAAAPVYVMLHNRFARPPKIRSIAVDVKVLAGDISGLIEDLRLDGQVYRPGQTLTGRLTLRRLRQPKVHLPVTFELPADLPEGQHTLTVCEANDSLRLDLRQSPHLFDPQTTAQLLQSIQLTVGRPNMDLYLRLPLAEGGLAIRKAELPNLPPSVAGAIADSRVPGTHAFERSLVRRQPTPYVINGSASASFTVSKRPTQTLIRQQKEPAP